MIRRRADPGHPERRLLPADRHAGVHRHRSHRRRAADDGPDDCRGGRGRVDWRGHRVSAAAARIQVGMGVALLVAAAFPVRQGHPAHAGRRGEGRAAAVALRAAGRRTRRVLASLDAATPLELVSPVTTGRRSPCLDWPGRLVETSRAEGIVLGVSGLKAGGGLVAVSCWARSCRSASGTTRRAWC